MSDVTSAMVPKWFFKLAKALVLQPLQRQMRGMTLGTRAVIINGEGEVLLVRHTYVPGWLLPGGGVERGETLEAACLREIREEAAVITEEAPVLHGIFLNDTQFAGDHVACFVLRKFRADPFKPNLEIADARFFPVNALPDGTTPGTRRRIAEVMSGALPPADW